MDISHSTPKGVPDLPSHAFSISPNGSSILLGSQAEISGFTFISSLPLTKQKFYWLLVKYTQNLTTSQHLHCSHPGLSCHPLSPRSHDSLTRLPTSTRCSLHSLFSTGRQSDPFKMQVRSCQKPSAHRENKSQSFHLQTYTEEIGTYAHTKPGAQCSWKPYSCESQRGTQLSIG